VKNVKEDERSFRDVNTKFKRDEKGLRSGEAKWASLVIPLASSGTVPRTTCTLSDLSDLS
jgi:hypothetical protein